MLCDVHSALFWHRVCRDSSVVDSETVVFCFWPLLEHRPPTRAHRHPDPGPASQVVLRRNKTSWVALLSLSLWDLGHGLMCDTDHWLLEVCPVHLQHLWMIHLLLVVAWLVSRVVCCRWSHVIRSEDIH